MSEPRVIRVKCSQCGKTNNCDEAVLDDALACGVCGFPMDIHQYPELIKLQEERNQRRKAQREEQKRVEGVFAEALKAERRQEKELRKKEKQERRESERQIVAAAEERQRQSAEQASELEDAADYKRLQHGGGCPRCGSTKLTQKAETSAAALLFLIIFSLLTLGLGIEGFVTLHDAETAFAESETVFQQEVASLASMKAVLTLLGALVCLIGLAICFTLESRRARCEKCGWKWKV